MFLPSSQIKCTAVFTVQCSQTVQHTWTILQIWSLRASSWWTLPDPSLIQTRSWDYWPPGTRPRHWCYWESITCCFITISGCSLYTRHSRIVFRYCSRAALLSSRSSGLVIIVSRIVIGQIFIKATLWLAIRLLKYFHVLIVYFLSLWITKTIFWHLRHSSIDN